MSGALDRKTPGIVDHAGHGPGRRCGVGLTLSRAGHVLALLLAFAGVADAQDSGSVESAGSVDLEVELEHAESGPRAASLEAEEPSVPTGLRRARALIPTGAILLAVGLTQLAAFGANRCYRGYEKPTFARRTGGALALLGFGLTIGGTFKLRKVDEGVREANPIRGRRRRALRGGIAGGLLLMAGAFIGYSFVEYWACVQS